MSNNTISPSSTEETPLNPIQVKPIVPRKVAFKELYRYATKKDYIMMSIGLFCAGIAGACYPLTTYSILLFYLIYLFFIYFILKPYIQHIPKLKI